jgi:hypothetical protein
MLGFRAPPPIPHQLLFGQPFPFLKFLIENVRLAIRTWPWSSALGLDWPTFLEAVLPYSVLNEDRNVEFRWGDQDPSINMNSF